jgi:hypothetical protein
MASKISDAAKAAAVRMFCSNVDDYDQALEIYNALADSHDPTDEVLEQFGAEQWVAFEHLGETEWWEQLELLAIDIDGAFDHFEFPLNPLK